MTNRDELEANVDRGIALLDERGPEDWRDRVNNGYLHMEDNCGCILGLVFGSFELSAVEELGLSEYNHGEMSPSEVYLIDHGFTIDMRGAFTKGLPNGAYYKRFKELENIWKEKLAPGSQESELSSKAE